MGRGRAKAKQTKVARELKYSSPHMDLEALQRELGGPADQNGARVDTDADEFDDYEDPYADDTDVDVDAGADASPAR